MCLCVYVCVTVCICVCACMSVYACVSVAYVCMWICECMSVFMCLCACVCICVCPMFPFLYGLKFSGKMVDANSYLLNQDECSPGHKKKRHSINKRLHTSSLVVLPGRCGVLEVGQRFCPRIPEVSSVCRCDIMIEEFDSLVGS